MLLELVKLPATDCPHCESPLTDRRALAVLAEDEDASGRTVRRTYLAELDEEGCVDLYDATEGRDVEALHCRECWADLTDRLLTDW